MVDNPEAASKFHQIPQTSVFLCFSNLCQLHDRVGEGMLKDNLGLFLL